mmetsp:Transcript_12298/g.28787  ORF Transcript_12298/g.28787 Transcript_12298/m.28787 type:complete len:1618 (+) Transcript_12298:216-5069(+)|eukprot:CAMPEP_0178372846 /NCGR_PEP_ID=MMETSP0689_2-20121128/1563_1 /TAXON_ID=160604 /ORGANISM="Amphidinium massartii, Strain CS-259" /LENGTH=1617 /DNA_ID=CAMNT_0019992781 /DNA_START=105 /DNA_END=4958 /DNA_ORIENTATION=+
MSEAMLFDVQEVKLRNWEDSESGKGVFLEIYLVGEKKTRKRAVRRLLPCHKKKKDKHKASECRRSTILQKERTEVLWREVNESGFNKSLFSMGGESWRLKKGSPLEIGADIFRCQLDGKGAAFGAPQKVQSLRGYVESTHGQVKLMQPELLQAQGKKPKRGEMYMSEEDEESRPTVTLDICRAQTQPFRLEWARPRPEQPRIVTRARSDTNLFSFESGGQIGGQMMMQSSSSNGKNSDQRIEPSSQRLLTKFWKFSDRSLSNLGGVMASEKSFPSKPPRPSIGSGSAGLHAGVFHKFGSGIGASMGSSQVHLDPTGSDDRLSYDGGGAVAGKRSRTASLGSDAMEKAAAQTLMTRGQRRNQGKFHFHFLQPFSHHKRHGHTRYNYNHWHPSAIGEWAHLWKGPWPVESEDLEGKHEVHPLMEAEFRKDCIVFFNTLFPRVKGENFMMLKAAALNVNSAVSFKVLWRPAMRAGSMGSIFGLNTRRYSFATAKASIADVEKSYAATPYTPYWRGMSDSNCSGTKTEEKETESEDLKLNEEVDGLEVPEENAAATVPETKERADEDAHFDQLARLAVVAAPLDPDEQGDRRGLCPGDLTLDHTWSARSMSGSNVNSEKAEDSSVAILSEPLVVNSTTPSRAVARWQRNDQRYYDRNSRDGQGRASGGRLRERRPSLLSQASIFGGQLMTSLNSTHSGQYIAPKLVMADKTQFADEYSPRIMFLKRLMLCFAICGVYYSEDERAVKHLWPYPIASILGHGSRVMIRLEAVDCYEFLNFLLAGDPKIVDWFENGGVPPLPLTRRIAATHAVTMERNELKEKKLEVTNVTNVGAFMDGALFGRHLGMNLPIGGAGNPSPLGKGQLVGLLGDVVKPESDMLMSAMDKVAKLMKKKLKRDSQESDEEPVAEANVKDILGLGEHQSKDLTAFTGEAKKATAAIRRRQRWRRARQLFSEWKFVPNVQGGHLYIRVDDHGEVVVPKEDADAGSSLDKVKKELRSLYPSKTVLELTEPRRRRMLEQYKPEKAGLLVLPGEPNDAAERHRLKVQNAVDPGGSSAWSHDGPVRIMRMMSEPSLPKYGVDSLEDVQWMQQRVWETTTAPLKEPPSVNALRLLLEFFHPDIVPYFGTGRFFSLAQLYQELKTDKSEDATIVPRCSLIKRGSGVMRLVEPMYIRLRYDNPNTRETFILMRMEPHPDARTRPEVRDVYIPAMPVTTVPAQNGRGEDLWRIPFEEWVTGNFEMSYMEFDGAVSSEDSHRIMQERGHSLNYPGLECLCRTHLVNIRMRPDSVDEFRKYKFKMPQDFKDSDADKIFPLPNPRGEAEDDALLWGWVPEEEVEWPQGGDQLPLCYCEDTWVRAAENEKYTPEWRSVRSLAPSEGVVSIDESRSFFPQQSTTPVSASNPLSLHGLGRTDSSTRGTDNHSVASPTASTPTSPKGSRKLGDRSSKPKKFLPVRRGSIGAAPVVNDPNRKPVHSVLLGLEGSMPGKQSPFNTKHDASGKSSAISAVGSRKWRAYKMNSALQVPSEIGGITMKINRAMFMDLQETCDKLDLVDPRCELLLGRDEGFSREMLGRRFLEKELFQNILSGNGSEARAAVDWMLDFRATTRTVDQAVRAATAKPARTDA